MKRTRFAVRSLVGLLLARVADVGTTYYFSPDLRFEGNPLVSVFRWGWTVLVATNVALYLLAGAAMIYWCCWPLRYEPCAAVTNVWTFASWAYFRKVYPFWTLIGKSCYKLPKNWPHCIQLVGFTLVPATILQSLWAVLGWFLIHHFHARAFFFGFWRAWWPLSIYWPLLSIFPLMYWFYHDEYRRYRPATTAEASADPMRSV